MKSLGVKVGAALLTSEVRLVPKNRELREPGAEFARQAELLDLVQNAIVVRDLEGRISFWNAGAEKMYGWTKASALGKTTHDLLHTSFPEPVEGIAARLAREGEWTGELVQTAKDGTRMTVESQWALRRARNGEPSEIMEVNTDITERKRMEDQLRKSHDELELRVTERTAALVRLAAAVESVGEQVFITDFSWHIEYANQAFYDITGYTANEVIGQEMCLLRAEEQDPSAYDRTRQGAMTGKPYASRYMLRRKDGTVFTVDCVISPVKDASGEIRNFVLVWRDMTEQLRLEEQLSQAHKMEAIGTLAGGIAHDFNNMLAVIMGNAELAMDDVMNGDLPERRLHQIFNAAKRGRDLVKKILTFSRKAQRQRTPTDVISVLQETFKFLRSTLPTTIKISLDIQSESGTILGDSVQVQQILINLGTNAAHAMRKTGGTLSIRLLDVAFHSKDTFPDPNMKPGHYLKLIVEDTGTGMTDEVCTRIFEPFFTTKKRGQGTGMGLSVVYGIVKSYHGAVSVESTPGKGSTFTIYLPKTENRARNQEDAARVVRGNQEHVLFIDDEQALVEIAAAMLEKLGYRVTAATDSKEAWNLFLEDPRGFDLVITDQTMPDLTGVMLAQKMMRIRADIPVILCTGYSETLSPEKARKAGVREFLIKPLVRSELAAAIRRALDEGEGGE
jgi:PAS domain S-box-containing protein